MWQSRFVVSCFEAKLNLCPSDVRTTLAYCTVFTLQVLLGLTETTRKVLGFLFPFLILTRLPTFKSCSAFSSHQYSIFPPLLIIIRFGFNFYSHSFLKLFQFVAIIVVCFPVIPQHCSLFPEPTHCQYSRRVHIPCFRHYSVACVFHYLPVRL